MEPINYILISITVFFGTFAGYALSLIAPEELKPLNKHIKFFYSILIGLIIAMTFHQFNSIVSWILFFIVVTLVYMVKYKYYVYSIMGIFLFISIRSNIEIISALLFLLGFSVVSLDGARFIKNDEISKKNQIRLLKQSLKRYIWIIPILILPFLFSYF